MSLAQIMIGEMLHTSVSEALGPATAEAATFITPAIILAIFISLLSTDARTAEILSSWSWMLCSYSASAAFSGSMDVLVVLCKDGPGSAGRDRDVMTGRGGAVQLTAPYVPM